MTHICLRARCMHLFRPASPSGMSGGGRLPRDNGRIVILFVLLFCLLPATAARAEQSNVNPLQVEAAFLRNFARYVTWPAHAFTDENSSWNICILGNERFDGVLEKSLYGRTEQGRPFKIFHADELERLPSCQIVFVGLKDTAKRRAALAGLKMLPVLTVGDAPGFLQEGGIIRFRVGERVEMSINLDQARSASLTIPTKMLEVSYEVLENGIQRRWR